MFIIFIRQNSEKHDGGALIIKYNMLRSSRAIKEFFNFFSCRKIFCPSVLLLGFVPVLHLILRSNERVHEPVRFLASSTAKQNSCQSMLVFRENKTFNFPRKHFKGSSLVFQANEQNKEN